MKRRKMNISPWYAMGLAVLLAVACLVGATGVSLARYRAEREASVQFKARIPERIYLGKIVCAEGETVGTFDATARGTWEIVDGQTQLDFAVANGISSGDYAQDDQQVYIRLVGSLGIGNIGDTVKVKLLVARQTELADEEAAEDETQPETAAVQYDTFEAVAVRIDPESPMYTTFGDGWVFSFPDQQGEEMSWTLEGGEQSCIGMRLVLEGADLTEASLLQLQVSGRFTQD